MHWQRRLLIIIAIALGAGVLAFNWKVVSATRGHAQTAAPAAPASGHLDEPSITYVDPFRGPKDAKNTIVEFGDYLCTYCQAGNKAIDQLLQERPDDIRYVWKNAPSPLHPGADTAAEAAMCAAKQGAFWSYHEKLFSDPQTYDQVSLAVMADNLSLDTAVFGNCLSSHEAKPLVDRTVAEARALDIRALPTLFINGTRYEGQLSYDQLVAAIDGTGK